MLKDIHIISDARQIDIDSVGITNYKLPIIFEGKYHTMSTFKVGVGLNEKQKVAHLSRIIQQLNILFANSNFEIKDLHDKLVIMKNVIESDNIDFNASFDISIPVTSPVSSFESYITPSLNLNEIHTREEVIKKISLSVLGTMLCPSSKAISLYGAHSQKCLLKTTLSGDIDDILVLEVVKIMRSCFSAEVFGVVKREDEKYLTEFAYNNPRFSEDLIRDVLLKLKEKYNLCSIEAELENFESIHEHNVYARGRI